jgi:hypothetical protein
VGVVERGLVVVWWLSSDDDGSEGGEGQREEGGGMRRQGESRLDVQIKSNKGCDPDLAFQLGFEESAPRRGEKCTNNSVS